MIRLTGITLASALLLSPSLGADLTTIPLSTNQALPVADSAQVDWSGFYGGVFAGVQNSSAGLRYAAGVNLGVNAQFDFYLLGAEVAVSGLSGDIGETSYGQILGRAGLVVGDDTVVYAASGYGIDLGEPEEQDVLLGGGLEYAVTDSISVRAQYLHGFPVQGDNSKDQVTLGAAFQF